MTPTDLQRIRASAGWRLQRVEVFAAEGGPVIVKGQRQARGEMVRQIFDWVARDFNLPILQVPVRDGGRAAQDVEVRRLGDLRAAGLPVPPVLHVDDEFFVRGFVPGDELAQELERCAGTPASLPLWGEGLRMIRAFHECGHYLSQAYARNFIRGEGGLTAIDFEEDPLEVMDLAQAQVRDWLLYLQSTVWLLPRNPAQLMPQWCQALQHEGPAQLGLMRELALRLRWLRHLPERRRPWGRDLITLQAAAAFLFVWASAGQLS